MKRLDLPYAEAVERVKAALKDEGFGILSEIDVRATLEEKLNQDFPHYVILGACNPHLAYDALRREREVGVLLPCNVVVYDDEAGGTVVAAADPHTLLGVVENTNLTAISGAAAERLRRALNAL